MNPIAAIIAAVVAVIMLILSVFRNGGKTGGDESVVYHGSSRALDSLEPRPSHVIDNEAAVFAARHRSIALMFIGKWNDADILFGEFDGTWTAMEMRPGAFKTLDVPGIIYHLPADTFHDDPRLGLEGEEVISNIGVTPIRTEIIDSALEEIRQDKFITLYEYAEPAHYHKISSPPRDKFAIVHNDSAVEYYRDGQQIARVDTLDATYHRGNTSTGLLIPGLGNGPESFNFDKAPDAMFDKMSAKDPRITRTSFQRMLNGTTLSIGYPQLDDADDILYNIELCCAYHFAKPTYVVGHSIGARVAHMIAQKLNIPLILLDPTPQYLCDEAAANDFAQFKGQLQQIVRAFSAELTPSFTPTLIIYSDDDTDPRRQDKTAGIERMRELYNNVEIIKPTNAGHFIHLTCSDDVARAINDFVASHRPAMRIIHVAGPPACGKTTMYKELTVMRLNATIIDLDDFYSGSNTDDYQAYIDKFIDTADKNIPIVFLGIPGDMGKTDIIYNVHPTHKYFIDIDPAVLLQRHFVRELNGWLSWMSNRDHAVLFEQLRSDSTEQWDLSRGFGRVLNLDEQKKHIEFWDNKFQDYERMSYQHIMKAVLSLISAT